MKQSKNNRQVLNKDEPIEDWYLHPRKGWKRERLWTRRNNERNRARWAFFQPKKDKA